jgi:hypothetical protein
MADVLSDILTALIVTGAAAVFAALAWAGRPH